ncbi:SAM-dependent methyltransferase [Nocardia transvalensis]|uniref:SAM-dependent methyltransferase n=1 Tax=Nocardia transvalensis TaxID=37333 RepID=A0A7W9UG61_9NOCA|nr:methyltransferase domain-containing protein [Nocardia transvalensis]MBB5911807.1 SAM-dependent methyltransferase [Nocardia transvalensis]
MQTEPYIFDAEGTELGREHLGYVETLFDAITTDCLRSTGIGPGARCLELGAGAGSIARWLADRVGPSGSVVAVDKNAAFLDPGPNVEVYEHDLAGGLPVDGPFDLIHARLLLMRLPRREQIFTTLVEALAPGGWLVIGDVDRRPQATLSAPTLADEDVWAKVMSLSHGVVAPRLGISFDWAGQVDDRMTEAGLADIGSVEYSRTVSGGDEGCLLHRNLTVRAESLLLECGVTRDELEHYRELMLDSRFRAWFYHFLCTSGRKPE